MVYVIEPVGAGEPTHLESPTSSDGWVHGQTVMAWDYCKFKWDSNCVPARDLAELVPVHSHSRSLPI